MEKLHTAFLTYCPDTKLTFEFNALEEEHEPFWYWDDIERALWGKEYMDKVRNGEYLYFCAEVVAKKAGVVLGRAYLGECIYSSYEEFYEKEGGYCDDLIKDAKQEALETLKKLAE